MTKQVDFYLIRNEVPDGSYKLASRLCNKLLRLDKKSLLVVDDNIACRRLDQVLWTFSDTSFVAHEQLTEAPASCIQLGLVEQVTPAVLERQYDVLITLCTQIPAFTHHFGRIAEIVGADEPAKAAARQRFKQYRNEGFELNTHDIEL